VTAHLVVKEKFDGIASPRLLFGRMQTLVCPHCQSHVPGGAGICTGCGAEIVRGANRRERTLVGLVFVGAAFLTSIVVLRAFEIARGAPPLPSPKSDAAFFLILGFIGFLVTAYMTGKVVARLFRKSQVRFYRSYQHQ